MARTMESNLCAVLLPLVTSRILHAVEMSLDLCCAPLTGVVGRISEASVRPEAKRPPKTPFLGAVVDAISALATRAAGMICSQREQSVPSEWALAKSPTKNFELNLRYQVQTLEASAKHIVACAHEAPHLQGHSDLGCVFHLMAKLNDQQ